MSNSATTDATTLDYISKFVVPGKPFEHPANEYWALVCLYKGLESLYQFAKKCDHDLKQLVNPSGNGRVFLSGNCPEFSSIPIPILSCAFNWYSVSATQYVRTIGAIAYSSKQTSSLPKDYSEDVIPDVVAYRNKVGAHFTWSSKNDRDNDAERLASIIPQLSFDNDTFIVGGLGVCLGRNGKESNSESITPWSITRVHESLMKRYWNPFQSS